MSEIPARDDLSQDDLRRFAHQAVDWMMSYLSSFGEEPIQPRETASRVFSLLREDLPEKGAPPSDILDEFQRKVVPFATSLQHPGNFATSRTRRGSSESSPTSSPRR